MLKTTLAIAVVWLALTSPDRLSSFGPWAFVRIPIEALVLAALLLVLRGTARRIFAVIVGVSLAFSSS